MQKYGSLGWVKKLAQFSSHRTYRRTTGLIWCVFSCVVGIALAKQPWAFSVLLVPAGMVAVFLWRKKSLYWLVALCVFGLSLGVWRGSVVANDYARYDALYNIKKQYIVTAKTDASYNDQKQLEFDAGDVRVKETGEILPGKVTVAGFGELSISRGDELIIDGKLFKTRGGKVARMSFADVEKTGYQKNAIETARKAFVAGTYNALPDPAASFALGLLVGQRTNLPDYVNDDFKATSLTHIVAVSGYNLTILVLFARRAFAKLSKYQSTLFAVLLIVGFLLITGFSAAIVRAAVVAGLGLAAWYVGREIKPLLLIGIAMAGTGLVSPYYVWADIGWYLSFLAFFGVLILSPLVQKRFVRSGKFSTLKMLVIDTLSAQVMTLPIILYIFGRMSLVGTLANIIVVPAVPFAMLASLVAGIAGIVWPVYAGIFALPAKIVLVAMLDITHLFAKVPGATANYKINVFDMVVLYLAIAFLAYVLYRKTRVQRGIMSVEKW